MLSWYLFSSAGYHRRHRLCLFQRRVVHCSGTCVLRLPRLSAGKEPRRASDGMTYDDIDPIDIDDM